MARTCAATVLCKVVLRMETVSYEGVQKWKDIGWIPLPVECHAGPGLHSRIILRKTIRRFHLI